MYDLSQYQANKRAYSYVWSRGLTLLVLVLVILVLIVSWPALSKPPEGANPAWGAWFKSLERPDVGGSCCDVSDCRTMEDGDWRPKGGGYQFLADGKWWDIPNKKILYRNDNPTGRAVLCASPYEDGFFIYCFTPGSLA